MKRIVKKIDRSFKFDLGPKAGELTTFYRCLDTDRVKSIRRCLGFIKCLKDEKSLQKKQWKHILRKIREHNEIYKTEIKVVYTDANWKKESGLC